MHSFEAPLGATFHYCPDLSGMITVQPVNPNQEPVSVAWGDIRAFYLEQRRKNLADAILDMNYDELEAFPG